mgnify:CR=1 FL=1
MQLLELAKVFAIKRVDCCVCASVDVVLLSPSDWHLWARGLVIFVAGSQHNLVI